MAADTQETDLNGRKWLHLTALQEAKGPIYIESDGGHDCMNKDVRHVVNYEDGYYVYCNDGRHYLRPNDVGRFVGFYGPFKTDHVTAEEIKNTDVLGNTKTAPTEPSQA